MWFGKNLINAKLTNILNSLSVSIINGIPVVPTFEINKSPYSGQHLAERILCSSSDMNLVLLKDNFPELISFTEMKGTPLSVYLGVLCVPSVNNRYMAEKRHQHQL